MPKNLTDIIVLAVMALIVGGLIFVFWPFMVVILALIGLGALLQWFSK